MRGYTSRKTDRNEKVKIFLENGEVGNIQSILNGLGLTE